MFDKSSFALFASGLNMILMGTVVDSIPTTWKWVLSFLGLMLMMFVLAPNAMREGSSRRRK